MMNTRSKSKSLSILLIATTAILAACGPTKTDATLPTDGTVISETEVEVPDVGAEDETQGSQPERKSVVAWRGSVISQPESAEYDDALIIYPEEIGTVGLTGANPDLEEQIVTLRDKEEPGNMAHFWGTLTCGVADFNGCQLVVERLRVDAPGDLFDPDPVEGWEGTIYSGPPGPRSGGDDYFALVGEFPVQYGIWGVDEGISSQIVSLRDTGTVVKIWGQVIAGIPDWNGTQIQVNRIEIVELPSGPIPPPPDWAEVEDGMQVYVNQRFNYQFRYPANATITEMGVMGFPSEELPEGISPEEYIAQLEGMYGNTLCVQVEFALGYLVISAPPNQGNRYTICGRTGVGAGDIRDKVEDVMIGTQSHSANGFEFIGSGETLDQHNETFRITLEDGTVIEYGSKPEPTATYEDYLHKGKPMILQILASFESIE